MIQSGERPTVPGRHREESRTTMIVCRCGRVSEGQYDHDRHVRDKNWEESPEPSRSVRLPFLAQFRFALLRGRKTATSRTEFNGNVGDTFEAYGATFRIVSVEELRLNNIAYDHFREEGLGSPEDFMEIWEEIHPRRGWDGSQKVDFIRFEMVKPAPEPKGQRKIDGEA